MIPEPCLSVPYVVPIAPSSSLTRQQKQLVVDPRCSHRNAEVALDDKGDPLSALLLRLNATSTNFCIMQGICVPVPIHVSKDNNNKGERKWILWKRTLGEKDKPTESVHNSEEELREAFESAFHSITKNVWKQRETFKSAASVWFYLPNHTPGIFTVERVKSSATKKKETEAKVEVKASSLDPRLQSLLQLTSDSKLCKMFIQRMGLTDSALTEERLGSAQLQNAYKILKCISGEHQCCFFFFGQGLLICCGSHTSQTRNY